MDTAPATRHVIILNGPIGAGKTTLGRALASELGAAFIDSDDLRDATKQWYEEVLTTSRKLVRAGCDALDGRSRLVVAKPLRVRDWHFLKASFGATGVVVHCVTLAARLDAMLDPGRGRSLDADERARASEMIQQGYAARPFSDAIVATDCEDFPATLARLAEVCCDLLAAPVPCELADGTAPGLPARPRKDRPRAPPRRAP